MNLSFVLPSGRLLEESANLLSAIGLEIPERHSREMEVKDGCRSFVFAKAFDVPVYVEHGIDIGIAGSDVVSERGCDVFIPLEFPFGKCRMSVIAPKESVFSVSEMEGYTVATKYPKTTERFFDSAGIAVNVVKLHGAVELGPKVGISDAIVDIVDSGNTMRANGLKEIGIISEVNAVLLVNRISQKTKFGTINEIVNRIRNLNPRLTHAAQMLRNDFKSIH